MINERSKLAQKEYNSSYDWVGKVIRWKLCKRLKFGALEYLEAPWRPKETYCIN